MKKTKMMMKMKMMDIHAIVVLPMLNIKELDVLDRQLAGVTIMMKTMKMKMLMKMMKIMKAISVIITEVERVIMKPEDEVTKPLLLDMDVNSTKK